MGKQTKKQTAPIVSIKFIIAIVIGMTVAYVFNNSAEIKTQNIIKTQLYNNSNINSQSNNYIGGIVGYATENSTLENNVVQGLTINVGSINDIFLNQDGTISYKVIKKEANLNIFEQHPFFFGVLASLVAAIIYDYAVKCFLSGSLVKNS